MRKALSITLVLAVALAGSAFAKPVDMSNSFEKFQYLDVQNGTDLKSVGNLGVFGTAQINTTYFGGTFWNGDSSRWEAIEDSTWTFESGVGSDYNNFTSDVNPFKDPALHTHMEGWVGIDFSFGGINPNFRRLSDGDAGWGAVCVGAGAGLEGNWSFWCGVLQSESNAACFAGGQGYGNGWVISIERSFTASGAAATLSYRFVNETEGGWDYTYVYVDTTGNGDRVEVANYTGNVGPANESIPLSPGTDIRSSNGTIKVIFEFVADGAWSDEDGLENTVCGAFAVDNIAMSGGVSYPVQNFELGADGWALSPATPGQGGEWSELMNLIDLPDYQTPCNCALDDSVLVFADQSDVQLKHGYYQDNIAASPWIDLKAAGLVGSPFHFIQAHVYAEMPLINYIFAQFNVQWYPTVCTQNGKFIDSPWTSNGFVYYFGGIPTCTASALTPTRIGGSQDGFGVDPGAEKMRIAVGVANFDRFWGPGNGESNSTPWFDYVRLGIFGDPDAPGLTNTNIQTPYDSFPQNGTLNANAAGRVDCNNVLNEDSPEPGSVLGDTLVVSGGVGGAEVRVQFAVDPGPYIAAGGGGNATYSAWLTKAGHVPENVWYGQQWYSARMDTAEADGLVLAGNYMTAYHESSPAFSGTDSDKSGDPDVHGNPRLANDIFADDLFTPGTRINMFFKTQYDGSGIPFTGVWYTHPDTTGGGFFEMEVLPSSMTADNDWNCVLYVDHFNRGAQVPIETALGTILTGGSENFEQTGWDRFDVNAESSQQGSFGRPLNTHYNANSVQVFAYKAIVWNSGNLATLNVVEEDANVLIPWLTLTDPGLQDNNLYLSGDGIAQGIQSQTGTEPSARLLLNEYCGVDYVCGTVRNGNCGNATQDTSGCLQLDEDALNAYFVPSANVPALIGNNCPTVRSFDLLAESGTLFGAPSGNEEYNMPIKGILEFHSVANEKVDGGDNVAYKTVVDGASVHYRVDAATCTDTQTAVTERLAAVLGWFGYTGSPAACLDPTAAAGIGDDIVRDTKFKTALANFAPNPLVGAAEGRIQFTMAKEGRAALDIFDVNGRLVRTVFDGIASEGVNEAFWNGTGSDGRPVASGVYFYRLRADEKELAKKLVVVRNGN